MYDYSEFDEGFVRTAWRNSPTRSPAVWTAR